MESEKEKFYITTTLPYVNAKPHIGFATEIVRADILTRYHKSLGKDVFFNTGTDEHGQKIYEGAIEEEMGTQEYVDKYAKEFQKLLPELGISEDVHFVRTTDEHHIKAAQEMWKRCKENGDIEKKKQTIKYCIGCELEKTDSELEDDKCPLHPNKELEIREEENYFFKFSNYGDKLLKFYDENPEFVVPNFRFNEIKKFIECGLQDFSISRLKEKMPWGVQVPGDEEHVMYVWFDALTNYISTTGWPEKENFDGWWPGIQVAGKDNLRQQSAIWQAMLMSAGLPNSKQVMIGGFITSEGHKMSKSLGNVIDPIEVKEKYGTEALRYFLARHVHPFEDTDVTWEKMDEWYTANLVNGLGNLTARIMKMAETHLDDVGRVEVGVDSDIYKESLDNFEFQKTADYIWKKIGNLDEYIAEEQPFKIVKDDQEKGVKIIKQLVTDLSVVASLLKPFMPETSKIILSAIKDNKKPENLFVRLS